MSMEAHAGDLDDSDADSEEFEERSEESKIAIILRGLPGQREFQNDPALDQPSFVRPCCMAIRPLVGSSVQRH